MTSFSYKTWLHFPLLRHCLWETSYFSGSVSVSATGSLKLGLTSLVSLDCQADMGSFFLLSLSDFLYYHLSKAIPIIPSMRSNFVRKRNVTFIINLLAPTTINSNLSLFYLSPNPKQEQSSCTESADQTCITIQIYNYISLSPGNRPWGKQNK